MSKTTAKALVSSLSLEQNEAGTTETFYVNTLQELSLLPLFTDVRLIEMTADTSQYTIPDDVGLLVEVFYDSEVIFRESLDSMAIHNKSWRDLEGPPEFYVVESESSKQFRLVPRPQVSSKDFSFILGEPMGRDFPEYSVGLIHTRIQNDNPDWMDLIVALKVTSKEFQKESRYQDSAFGALCGQVADLLLTNG